MYVVSILVAWIYKYIYMDINSFHMDLFACAVSILWAWIYMHINMNINSFHIELHVCVYDINSCYINLYTYLCCFHSFA